MDIHFLIVIVSLTYNTGQENALWECRSMTDLEKSHGSRVFSFAPVLNDKDKRYLHQLSPAPPHRKWAEVQSPEHSVL